MTRQELDKLIALHESRLAYFMNILNHHYYDIEARDEQKEWADLLTKEKKILNELKAMKADDE